MVALCALYCTEYQRVGYFTHLDHQELHMDRDAGKVNFTVLYSTVLYQFSHYSTVMYCTASMLQGGIFD